jgi:hypothetical protein
MMDDRRINMDENGNLEGSDLNNMHKKIRRINLYGGPACGKSTMAASIFAELKRAGKNIEFVSEYIKLWTYIPIVPTGYDSYYCQSKHIHKEDIILRAGTDLIISDSPVLLAYYYASHYNTPAQDAMLAIHKEFERDYPSINIILEREDKFYDQHGRYENLEQSKEIDAGMINLVIRHTENYKSFSCLDQDGIIKYITSEVSQ